MKKTRDFQFKQFNLKQEVNAMKFGTDSAILGAYVSDVNPRRILDIGSGTGVLALMLAQRFERASIDGVELDELSCAEARFNFSQSPWKKRLKAIHANIKDYSSEPYDLVVSNPPYFKNSLKNKSEHLARVRHTDSLQFNELFQSLSQLLGTHGKVFLILPYDLENELVQIAVHYKLYLNSTLAIYSYPESPQPVRGVFQFSFESDGFTQKDLVIYREKGKYTDAFTELLKLYYLHF